MEVRWADARDDDEEAARNSKVALLIEGNWTPDAFVSLEDLLDLRAEIDKFLLREALKR